MNSRLIIFFITIMILFSLLLGGLFYIQIVRGDYYKELSEKNRIIIVPLEGARGRIFDRNGIVIADNRLSFDVALIYENATNIDELSLFLSEELKQDRDNLISKMESAKLSPFKPTVIVEDISREKAIILEQYRIDYPGLMITTKAKRNYIYKNIASSVVGYLGKISEGELGRKRTYGYRITDLVGKIGLEKKYDNYLKGIPGGMQVEVDALGRQKRILHVKEPEAGSDLHLTIDMKLQTYCDKLFDKNRGSIICMDPKTGAVLALVSKPNFDPSIFIASDKNQEIITLLNNVDNDYPLLNRAISCAYPPGSVFKIIVATAALQTEKFSNDEILFCGGIFYLSDRQFRCWRKSGHAGQVLEDAIKNSCNVFFYQLGLKIGVNDIVSYAMLYGFGQLTGIDLPGESIGLLPSPKWKRQARDESWYAGDTVNYSIGQGPLLVTPIQVVRMISAFANGDYLVMPHIVERIGDIKVTLENPKKVKVKDETIEVIRSGLNKVVNDPRGTGMKARMADVVIAGKTGTAQNPTGDNHGWFAAFAPFDDPRLSVLIFDEYGGKGGVGASISGRQVIEKAKKLGML